jgi:hypothetical protein
MRPRSGRHSETLATGVHFRPQIVFTFLCSIL